MTRDEVRVSLKKKIELGLFYYLIETDLAERISISVDTVINNENSDNSSSDKWRNWVFQSAGELNFENETSRKESNVRIELDADKVTDKIKLQFDVDFERSNSKYENQDNIFISTRNRKSFGVKSVWSINEKWSAGFNVGASGDTYQNINYRYYIMPAIEYSFFPYDEFVRREMVINYRIGYGYRNYIEETIYDKFEENVYLHQIAFETRFRQPWGEIYSNLRGKSFIHDPSKNSFSLDSWFSIRVFEGLSVRFGGEVEIIRDQLNLPKGNASIEDLLLQQQEIATLAYLSKKARRKLDNEGLDYVSIVASNDLDEFLVESLKNQKSKISIWGIGTKLVTAYDNPSLGAVYKLTALKNDNNIWEKKIKLSEQKIKINNPGINQVMRFKKNNKFFGDMIYEQSSKIDKLKMIDPNDSTRKKVFNKSYDMENLLIPIFKKGKYIYKNPSIEDIKKKLSDDLDLLDNSHKRLNNPHTYPVGIEENLFLEKQKMILNLRK